MEKEFRLLKKRVVIDRVTKKGLDDMRKWYLYQEIRPLCYDNKYVTYPKSTVPKTRYNYCLTLRQNQEMQLLEADGA
jgi:hypothetical protein